MKKKISIIKKITIPTAVLSILYSVFILLDIHMMKRDIRNLLDTILIVNEDKLFAEDK